MARVFQACDKDNKGCLIREYLKGLLFENFLNLTSAKKTAQLHSNETRQTFTAFDVQDKGFLTFEDFNRAFNSISLNLPEKIIVEAFREVNQNSDGCISFKKFESAIKYGQNVVSPVYFA
ncbi:EF-hand calcium-binding domain-containing protein 11 [Pezoporus occidentalis]|uniref:EF-hand calcium-binding domain-containing protein 11 n=1 Tax=Pezoporus occidentalis TaxID=407982 RepID=UPI002F916A26